ARCYGADALVDRPCDQGHSDGAALGVLLRELTEPQALMESDGSRVGRADDDFGRHLVSPALPGSLNDGLVKGAPNAGPLRRVGYHHAVDVLMANPALLKPTVVLRPVWLSLAKAQQEGDDLFVFVGGDECHVAHAVEICHL